MVHRRQAPAILAGVLLACSQASAQTPPTTGIIGGIVLDPSGAPVAEAAIDLTQTATNFTLPGRTDRAGRFRAPLLPIGPYRIAVRKAGFATLHREGVDLSVGEILDLDLRLTLAGVEEQVVVRNEAPLVERSNTEVTTLVGARAARDLPNNGRNFLELLKLTPAVAGVEGVFSQEYSISGQRTIQNNIAIDGADFQIPFFGEPRGGFGNPLRFNLDAIAEVVVISDGANAEYGRTASGVVNLVTKSGTNQLRGSGYLFWKDDAFSAPYRQPDGADESFEFSQWQAGATLGGALLPDRLFYFVAVDGQTAESVKQTDALRIEPSVVAALASLGSPGESGPVERTTDVLQGLAKLDWRASQSHLATLRYDYGALDKENGFFDVDSWGRSASAADERARLHALVGSLVSTLSANFSNELRLAGTWQADDITHDGPNLAGQARGLPDISFDFQREYRFGQTFSLPIESEFRVLQAADSLWMAAGRHAFKGGFEYIVSTTPFNQFPAFHNGRFIFGSTDGFLRYLANPNYVECADGSSSQGGGCPSGVPIVGPVLGYFQLVGLQGLDAVSASTQEFDQHSYGVYLQDTWQPTSNLTVNAGLRWDNQIAPDPITPPEEVFYAPFVGQVRNGQRFPADGSYPDARNLWQPRLAFSWDPFGDRRTALRGSAGIFSGRIPGVNYNPARIFDGSRSWTLFLSSALQNFGAPAPPPIPVLIPQQFLQQPNHPAVIVVANDFEAPRTRTWSASVERGVGEDVAVILKYTYAQGDRLGHWVNRNDALLGSPWFTGLPPAGGNGVSILSTLESTARSRYWGWTLGVQKRLSRRWALDANYTYSEDKSDDDNDRNPFIFSYAKITALDREWSYSDRDQRHKVNAYLAWSAPLGLDVGARYSYRSAQPKSVRADGSDALTPQDRINPDGTVARRNTSRKDNAFSSLDLRLARAFRAGLLTIEPSLDVFNVFDDENRQDPPFLNLVLDNALAVRSGAGDPRQAQLGLRVSW